MGSAEAVSSVHSAETGHSTMLLLQHRGTGISLESERPAECISPWAESRDVTAEWSLSLGACPHGLPVCSATADYYNAPIGGEACIPGPPVRCL